MKHKLDLEDLAAEFFEGARLFGVVAPMKGYRFCWQLNRELRLDFRINNQIEIPVVKKQRKYFFSVYECPSPHSPLIHYLYTNQFDGEYLVPELRHLDFFWLLKGDEIGEEAMQSLAGSIRAISGVQMVMELSHEKIKHRDYLIL
jgi:hypothetical protein